MSKETKIAKVSNGHCLIHTCTSCKQRYAFGLGGMIDNIAIEAKIEVLEAVIFGGGTKAAKILLKEFEKQLKK